MREWPRRAWMRRRPISRRWAGWVSRRGDRGSGSGHERSRRLDGRQADESGQFSAQSFAEGVNQRISQPRRDLRTPAIGPSVARKLADLAVHPGDP